MSPDEGLDPFVTDIHRLCHEGAEEFGTPGDYVLRANTARFQRAADAMVALGVA